MMVILAPDIDIFVIFPRVQ